MTQWSQIEVVCGGSGVLLMCIRERRRLELREVWDWVGWDGFDWVCSGYAVGMQWVCSGCAVGLQWVCSEYAVGIQWVWSGYAVGMQWEMQWVWSRYAVGM